MSAKPKEQAWLATAVKELNDNGSWTGRIHAHKLLAVAELLGLADSPFEFQLYEYGPYSFELDQAFTTAESCGFLSREYPQAGYGPKYRLTPNGEGIAKTLERSHASKLARVAKELGDRGSKSLELLATCLWVEKRENKKKEDQIINRVRELKPKYSQDEVATGLSDARRVAASLSG